MHRVLIKDAGVDHRGKVVKRQAQVSGRVVLPLPVMDNVMPSNSRWRVRWCQGAVVDARMAPLGAIWGPNRDETCRINVILNPNADVISDGYWLSTFAHCLGPITERTRTGMVNYKSTSTAAPP